MNEYIKTYWPIFVSIVTLAVAAFTSDAVQTYRIGNLEARQDRQSTSIMTMQLQLTGLSNDISGVKAKLDSINENVNYIRNRIDRVTQ